MRSLRGSAGREVARYSPANTPINTHLWSCIINQPSGGYLFKCGSLNNILYETTTLWFYLSLLLSRPAPLWENTLGFVFIVNSTMSCWETNTEMVLNGVLLVKW